MRRRLRRAVALLILGAIAGPVVALAGVVPDSSEFAKLHARRWNRFHVVTARSTFELTTLVFGGFAGAAFGGSGKWHRLYP